MIETVIILKNVQDATSVEGAPQKSLLQTLKEIKTVFAVKKDPVLQAILSENAITMTSTIIPLTCQMLLMISHSIWIDAIGCGIIGFIQM